MHGMNRENLMTDFAFSYRMSATVLAIMLALSCLGSIGSGASLAGTVLTALMAGAVPFLPIRLNGGLDRRWKMAVAISMLLAIGSTALPAFIILELARTEDSSLQGSPAAAISGIMFFTLIITLPWLLTSLRGLRLMRYGMKNTNPIMDAGHRGNEQETQ